MGLVMGTVGLPGQVPLPDLPLYASSNIARNANPGSFMAYQIFVAILLTGLIGAFFDLYFPIMNLQASNQE